jgi:RNA polymerase sigma factor (sigma-70 family)
MATDGPTGPISARSGIPIDPPGSGARLQGFRLARRASRGDRAAFEQIFRRHHQELYRYSLAIVHDRDDAEDVMQATMAAALRALPGEDRRIDIRPWLFRIAHNESISLLRRRRPDQLDEASIPERAGGSQEETLEIRDRLRRLVGDLNDLPERQRAALVMRELSGLSYDEIGEALTCSEGGARQAVFEARTALRELEEGREMECEEVRRAISERDGRRLRARKLRAHLSGCDGCSGFAAAIPARRADLSSLCPPLPAAAAGTILTGLLGGGGGAATGAGAAGIAGGGMAASLAIKGGSIAAAIALAAGVADVGGLIDIPNPVAGSKASTAERPAPAPAAADARPQPDSTGSAGTQPASNHAGPARAGDRGDVGPGRDDGSGSGGSGGPGSLSGSAGAPGNSASTPAPAPAQDAGPPATSGNSSTAPGQTGATPGGGSVDAPGQTGVLPDNATTAPGHSAVPPGNSATAPGQTATTPPGQSSNNGNANGNDSK